MSQVDSANVGDYSPSVSECRIQCAIFVVAGEREIRRASVSCVSDGDYSIVRLYGDRVGFIEAVRAGKIGGHFAAATEANIKATVRVVSSYGEIASSHSRHAYFTVCQDCDCVDLRCFVLKMGRNFAAGAVPWIELSRFSPRTIV